MPANVAAQGGQSQIDFFEFESNYDKPRLDLAGGIIELNYYESILESTVRVSATFSDTGYRNGSGSAITEQNGLKMTVGEKVNLKFTDGYGSSLSFDGNKSLVLKNPRPSGTTNKIFIDIDFYTQESVNNDLTQFRVTKRYDGKISDTVSSILTDVLKTRKTIDIDPTLNTLSVLPTTTKPFYQCTWLGPMSVPDLPNAQGKLAGYFFYETYDGFKFKSIDKLLSERPKKKLIFNNVSESSPPPGYDAKILEPPYFSSSFDLKTILQTGSHLKTTIKGVNTYESSYRENDADSKDQFNGFNNAGTEQPIIAKFLSVQDQSSKISFRMDNQGFLVPGENLLEQLQRSTFINHKNDDILRQSHMRYNNLFSNKLSIVIPGDFSLHVGDLVHCDIPEVSSNTTKVVSTITSGIYMIADMCHRITKNGCYTRLNLVRDSIGRKPS